MVHEGPRDQLRKGPHFLQKMVPLETWMGRAPALPAQSLGAHTCPHEGLVPGVSCLGFLNSLAVQRKRTGCPLVDVEVSQLEVAGPLVGTAMGRLAVQEVYQVQRDRKPCSTGPPQHRIETKTSAVQITRITGSGPRPLQHRSPATQDRDQDLCSTDPPPHRLGRLRHLQYRCQDRCSTDSPPHRCGNPTAELCSLPHLKRLLLRPLRALASA